MKHTLEGHKLFPIIAWVAVIGFTLFAVNLTLSINAKIEEISQSDITYDAKATVKE